MLQDFSDKSYYKFQESETGEYTYLLEVRDSTGQTVKLDYKLQIEDKVQDVSSSSNQQIENDVNRGNSNLYNEDYSGESQDLIVPNAKSANYTNILEIAGTMTASRGNATYANRWVVLSTDVTQGNGGYEYRYRESYNGSEKTLQDYSGVSTYGFTSAGLGVHTYHVDIRDVKGKSRTLSYVMTVVAEPDKMLTGELVGSKGNKVYMNRGVTLTANLSNYGYDSCSYKFSEVYDGVETVLNDFSPSNTFSFQTSKVGLHEYIVDIMDQQGQTLRLSYQIVVVAEEGYQLQVELSSSKTGTVYTNRGIMLTAKAISGYGDYEYQFEQVYNGYKKVLQSYSSSNKYEFKTGIPGTYKYTVLVRDKSNAKTSASLTLYVISDGSIDFGIDVSVWNETVNWSLVKQQGVKFAMVRSGYGTAAKDKQFEANYSGARNQGIRVGVYHYSYATNVTQALQEADSVIRILNGRSLDLPVAFDIEDPSQAGLSATTITAITTAFCNKIRAAGYTPMVYSMASWFGTKLDITKLADYKIWVASRGVSQPPSIGIPISMWQYSSSVSVPGANTSGGVCDVNYAYGL